jgi:(1->4)-alpha-D-glucan 1-alpha-D-glucosylmutase
MDNKIFHQICDFLGVEPLCLEGGESWRSIPAESKRTFLAALGLDITDERGALQALDKLRRDHWRQVISPVLVAEEKTSPILIELRLPLGALSQPLRWLYTEENGASREGEVIPAEHEIGEETELDGERYVPLRLTLDLNPPVGYHKLTVSATDGKGGSFCGQCTLIITPLSCYTPPGLLQGARIWGISTHLDTIRSRRNWGIGDLTDLQNLLSWAAENGAGTVTVSSLLSRRLPQEDRLYPNQPSSRCFLDPLYLDLEAVADFHESEEVRALVNDPAFQVRLANLRDAEQVDYEEVAAVKKMIAEELWQYFQLNHLNPETERGWAYRHFQQTGGQRLYAFAVYETLREHWWKTGEEEGCRTAWPEKFQDPASQEVADFAHAHQQRIEFHQYLQWQHELQLAEVGKRSLELGLKVGLTQSLPAGVDQEGFAAWHHSSLYGKNLQMYDSGGTRDCHLSGPPVLPAKMAEMAYEPFIAMLRFNMRYAGALRFCSIDVLERQLWKSAENTEADGLYVAQRTADLLGIIALESQRNRCLIIGEHHEALSDTFADELHRRGILVSRPGFFAKDQQGDWLTPPRYPSQSAVMASRYDIYTLSAFWHGRDIALLSAMCPCFDNVARENAVIARASDRAHLLVALKREGLLPQGYDMDPAAVPMMTPALMRAVHFFLVRTLANIFLLHTADLPVETDEDMVPENIVLPVWRQKMRVDLETMAADEQLQQFFRVFCHERGIGVVRPSALLSDRRKRKSSAIPRSFYRLQFNRNFTFRQAAAIVPYLKELGISHCYASPYLKARPGSSHGYDIIDHASLNPEIGSREDYEEFVAALDRYGMAQILDMVPNHIGVGPDNRWWVDVLENSLASSYADFFDINWQPQEEELKNRILLPVLGDYFGAVLEGGQLRLVFLPSRGCFFISYYEHFYPIAPKTYPHILGHDLQRLETRLGNQHEGFLELQSLIASFAGLPGREEISEEKIAMRNRNKEVLKRLLARLCREVPEIAAFIEENVIYYNGEPGRPESFDPLERLLAMQAYRLAFWRVASDEINYRRFFDINDLAGIRVENKQVFDETHRFVLDLIATGKIDGLRIDHPDGLYDPGGYFSDLQTAVSGVSLEQWEIFEENQSVHDRQASLPLYVVAEKILADFERLPCDWKVHGTIGYDFSCLVNGLFVDQSAEKAMTDIYHQFIGRSIDFALLLYDCKKLIIRTAMAGELNVLSDQLHRLAKRNRYTQDYTLNGLREALIGIVACFPVYRTYVTSASYAESDRQYVELAVDRAKGRQQAEDTSIYDFVKSVLLLEMAEPVDDSLKTAALDFVMKFQQYTGPVMAKGLEDTAFYRYNRLLSVNEVGSDPRNFGVSVALFHEANEARAESWPHAMLNTSTHDSKRSEDVRARINVLSEMTDEWREAVIRWHGLNREKKKITGQGIAPSKNDEYALYQNLLGVWPFEETAGGAEREVFLTRFAAYMLKVIREAKVHTSWMNQNLAYEEAMTGFIRDLLEGEGHAFLDDFIGFQKKIAWFGMFNSLSQLLLKLTSQGVPDIYQGNEIWQFCLVDPDNRRPVDFEKRMGMLAELGRSMADPSLPPASRLQQLLQNPCDGRVKMYTLWKTLTYRQENPGLFERGSYFALDAVGAGKEHLCAFGRSLGERTLIVAVPRLVARLLNKDATRMPLGGEVWGDTVLTLPENLSNLDFINILTGEEVAGQGKRPGIYAANLFSLFPLALLAAK